MVSSRAIVVRDLTAFTERSMRELTLEVHANLVRAPREGGTPVNTGWARVNWIPAIGKPVTEPDGERPPDGVPTQAGSKALSGLAEVAARYRLSQGPIFITNNVPYILKLNDGSSSQAPAGFVQAAILEAVQEIVSRRGK